MPNATNLDQGSSEDAEESKQFASLPKESVAIEKQRFLELVEVDLWSKFQKRLWAVITGFLVVVSVAGFLGIPYYIESQTNAIFAEQSKKYEEEVRRTTAYLKSYLLLTSKYEVFHQRLRQDIYTVLQDLDQLYENNADISRFGRPDDILLKILHEDDPRDLINQRGVLLDRWYNPEDYEDLELSINETIHLENTIFGATGSTSARHPYRNGTLTGFIEDTRMKIFILAAFKEALESQRQEIFQIGGTSDLEKRTRGLEVEAIANAEFLPRFDSYVSNNSEKIAFSANVYADPQEVFRFYIEVLNFDPTLVPSITNLTLRPKKGDQGALETDSSADDASNDQ